MRLNNAIQPSCADSPDNCAMATGPINCFGEVSRVISPHTVWKMRPEYCRFFSTASVEAPTRPGLMLVVSSAIATPSSPVLPVRFGVAVIVSG